MHELGIAASALEHALQQARGAGATRVSCIALSVGSLSGVEPESLRFALEAGLPGTAAEGATVEIETIPALLRCRDCGGEFQPDRDLAFACPQCRQCHVEVLRGRELHLSRLEVF